MPNEVLLFFFLYKHNQHNKEDNEPMTKSISTFFYSVQMCQIDLYPSVNHQIEAGKLEHPCLFNQLPPPNFFPFIFFFFSFKVQFVV